MTQIWEDARNLGIKKISQISLRVFEASDAFKLMGAIARLGGEVTVKLEASYETKNSSNLEMEFEGTIADVVPIRDFLQAQFRASGENSLNTTFNISYSEGLSLIGDEPEKLTEQLSRFATGTALVEACAEGE